MASECHHSKQGATSMRSAEGFFSNSFCLQMCFSFRDITLHKNIQIDTDEHYINYTGKSSHPRCMLIILIISKYFIDRDDFRRTL